MKFLVTGAAGYIGSVVTEQLVEQGYDVVAFDSLKYGHRLAIHPKAAFVEGNLLDHAAVADLFKSHQIGSVVHLAAEAAIDLSVRDPGIFFQVNVAGGLNLLDAMIAAGVKNMVFSSTAAVYGEPEAIPITEDAAHEPVNSYGESKLQFERAMAWYRRAHGLNHISFRYFNACGASANYGEHREKETHIIPLLFEVALGKRKQFSLFGNDYETRDGTCVRDYVHVEDIAKAHVLGLQQIERIGERAYNIGSGTGNTNREVVAAVESVIGRSLDIQGAPRRLGDPAQLVASNDLIRAELQWEPKFTDLIEMVRTAWEWRQGHPDGYTA